LVWHLGANQLYDVPKEIMPIIPEHWGNFPPQESSIIEHLSSAIAANIVESINDILE
jgi:hypothetical protein